MLESFQPFITHLALSLKMAADVISMIIILIGIMLTLVSLFRTAFSSGEKDFFKTRFVLSRSLMLALEFLIAADILVSAVAPTWDQLGKLGVIVLIRVVLSFFLSRDIKEYERALPSS